MNDDKDQNKMNRDAAGTILKDEVVSVSVEEDLNAHIENIVADISKKDEGSVQVHISFDNLNYGTVKAVKFFATAYNSLNDVVPVNGWNKFYLVIQDINIEPLRHAENLVADIPNSEIRKLDLTEAQVLYSDGSIKSYDGPNIRKFEALKFKNSSSPLVISIRDQFGEKANYIPVADDTGWVCCCGYYNDNKQDTCLRCGNHRNDVLKLQDLAYRSSLIDRHNDKLNQIAKQKAKETRRKVLTGIIISAAAILIISASINNIILSGRTTYSSEDEMQEAIEGTYYYYGQLGETISEIEIQGDDIKFNFTDLDTDPLNGKIETLNYKRGVIVTTIGDYEVTTDGDIKEIHTSDPDLFERSYLSYDDYDSYDSYDYYSSGY